MRETTILPEEPLTTKWWERPEVLQLLRPADPALGEWGRVLASRLWDVPQEKWPRGITMGDLYEVPPPGV